MFDELNPAAGAGGDGGVSPAPTDSGVSGPPPDGSVAGSPPAGLNWETAPQQFRDGHQRLQTEYQQTKQGLDRWTQLGNYDDIQRIHQAYNGLQSEASQLGQYLGFDPREISDTFRREPWPCFARWSRRPRKRVSRRHPRTCSRSFNGASIKRCVRLKNEKKRVSIRKRKPGSMANWPPTSKPLSRMDFLNRGSRRWKAWPGNWSSIARTCTTRCAIKAW